MYVDIIVLGCCCPAMTAAKATGWSLGAFIKAEPHKQLKTVRAEPAVTLLSLPHIAFVFLNPPCVEDLLLPTFFCLLMVNKLLTESDINVC